MSMQMNHNIHNETVRIAGTAAALSAMTTLGVMGWWCIPGALSSLSLYIAFIAFFHVAEFFAVAISAVATSTITSNSTLYDAFLLDNGGEYVMAVVMAAVEFAVECKLFGGWGKTSKAIRFIGIALALLGQSLRTWTIVHAGPHFTHHVQETITMDHELVTDGPFRVCRHPAYAGFFWWAVGLQLLLANPVCLVGYVVVMVDFFGKRIWREERALMERFGADYVSFRRRTITGIPTIE